MRRIFVLAACLLLPFATLAQTATQPAGADKKEDGPTLYNAKCAMCHGKDGVAKKMAQGSGNFKDPNWQKEWTVEKILEVSTKGKNKMPKFEGKLTTVQLKLVAEFVKTLK